MTVTATFADAFIEGVFNKEHNVGADSFKIMLMDTSFVFDKTTHALLADVSANEIADGFGYTAGGETLSGVAVAVNNGSGSITVSANPTWTASGGSIATTGAAIVYNDTHASKALMMCIDFGADYSTADGKLFQIDLSGGLGNITVSVGEGGGLP